MRLVVFLAFACLAARLVQLQAASGARYSAIAANQVTTVQQLPAVRGGIYDRNGEALAISVQRSAVVADPFVIGKDSTAEAASLAPVLREPEATLESEMTENSGYVYLAKLVTPAVAQAVQKLDLPGINLVPETERVDPAAPLASSLIGSVGADGDGQSGLEYQYNSLLSGRSGTLTDEEAPSGVVLPNAPSSGSQSKDGDGIELTVDEPLQYEAEQALTQALHSTHAISGTVILMDVHTGDILAMANLVANPATHQVTEASQNLALTSVYEPGSVFKLVTFTAALSEGVITPSTELTIPPYMIIDGSVFHDAEDHPTEQLSATQVLAQSSNLGTIEIAQRIGAKAVFDQMRRLGIGQFTGLGFPGESRGLVEPLADWVPTDLASTAIGQNTAVTPMQVLDMMNTVASGGWYVPPRLVQAVVQPDGSVREISRAEPHRVLTTAVTSQMTSMLEQVVSDGTAPGAAVSGYAVAGKTGTAQIPNPKAPGYLSGAYMATFTGYAPAQDPAISAIVVLNRPTPIYGGTAAGPVFSRVMSYALRRYGIGTSPGAAAAQASAAAANPATDAAVRPLGSPAVPGPSTTSASGSSPADPRLTATAASAATTPTRVELLCAQVGPLRSAPAGTVNEPRTPGTIARSAGHKARSP